MPLPLGSSTEEVNSKVIPEGASQEFAKLSKKGGGRENGSKRGRNLREKRRQWERTCGEARKIGRPIKKEE